ncbi:MAG: hypothetical protein K9M15_02885 [Candidatus Marinimicrobia bacterium]|nr:hypothetical protein [Candidatus Neomarinimicrobiota bacterium]
MKIVFDEERAFEVFKILEKDWREEKGVFNGVVLPQDRWTLPEDPLKLTQFLFYAALFMRGGIISDDPFKWLYFLFKQEPELFDSNYIVSEGVLPEEIEERLISFFPLNYKIDEHSKAWHHNSHVIVDRWGGDPRKIFDGIDEFEEAFFRVDWKKNKGQGIRGMRRKIFSLFTIWLQEKSLIPIFPCPVPVDFHALRVLVTTESVVFKEVGSFVCKERHPKILEGKKVVMVTGKVINEITKWSQDFLDRTKISHMFVNPALWVLSRELCVKHLQNSTKNRGKSVINAQQLEENPFLWPRKYVDPCAFCPLEKYCTGVVPSAFYYRRGLLFRMEKALYRPVQSFFPGMVLQDFRAPPYTNRSRINKK